jgi:hypothetical protein
MLEPRWRFAVRPFLTRPMAGSPAKRERGVRVRHSTASGPAAEPSWLYSNGYRICMCGSSVRATFGDVAGDANRQTSVRVPHEAIAPLERVAVGRGLSRDATVRTLLEEYLAFQSSHSPDERLTHVSTKFRISPTLKQDAIEHAFVLPGQSAKQGTTTTRHGR